MLIFFILFKYFILFFRPHKIRLHLSEDAADASTSKKSFRRPQSRRIEQKKFKRIQSGEVHDTKSPVPTEKPSYVPLKKIPRPKHGEIDRKKKIQQDMQKLTMRKSFTAYCTE